MFKGLTKDLAGTADICSIVPHAAFATLHASSYTLAHDGEELLFAFTSAKEEFAFTSQALVTVRGETAATTRRVVERFELRDWRVANVQFETTGRVDRDCELKFELVAAGRDISTTTNSEASVASTTTSFSIDIARKEEAQARAYYKALLALAREQHERARKWGFALTSLSSAAGSLKLATGAAAAAGLAGQATETLAWLSSDFERLNSRCYKDVIVNALASQQQT